MPNMNIVICPGCGSQMPLDNRAARSAATKTTRMAAC